MKGAELEIARTEAGLKRNLVVAVGSTVTNFLSEMEAGLLLASSGGFGEDP